MFAMNYFTEIVQVGTSGVDTIDSAGQYDIDFPGD